MKFSLATVFTLSAVASAKSSFRKGGHLHVEEDKAFWSRILEEEYSLQVPTATPLPQSASPITATVSPVTTPVTPGPVTSSPVASITSSPVAPATSSPVTPVTSAPVAPATSAPVVLVTSAPIDTFTSAPVDPGTSAPVSSITSAPIVAPLTSAPVVTPLTSAPGTPLTSAPTFPETAAPIVPVTSSPLAPLTGVPTFAPETPAPINQITPVPVTPGPSAVSTTPPTGAPITAPPTVAPVPIIPLTPAPIVPLTPAPTTLSPTVIPVTTAAPTSVIFGLISSVAINGGTEFEDPSSYQSKAVAWMEGNALTSTLSDERNIQRYALACIWFSTNAVRTPYTDAAYGLDVAVPGWISTQNWLGDASTECSWFGISCDTDSMVTKIELFSNRLTGSFPPETQLLASSLTYLDLFNNIVWNPGAEYNDFLGELTNLIFLYYGNTNFEFDGIPTAIGKLSNLVEYDASFTLYFGAIQGSIFENMPFMNYLVLGGNAYNSSIPVEIGQLPALEFFYAEDSFLSGDLSFMEPMQKIAELWVDTNPGLGGTIPTFLGSIATLQSFSISECGFNGPIPSELGNLAGMKQMWFFDNTLTGVVPTEIGRLTRMELLKVELNLITGTMPSEICANRDPLGLLVDLESDCVSEMVCTCCTACS